MSEPSRRSGSPSSYSAPDERRRIAEMATSVTITASGITLLDAGSPLGDREAAARATVSCGVSRDDGIWITECAWCDRLRTIGGKWVVVTTATRAAMRVERTHGICPRCSEACIARASAPLLR